MITDLCCVEAVPSSISELKKLEVLDLRSTGITGTLDFDHHPMMILIQNPSFLAVPNIGELKALTYLNLEGTGITGTVDFDHHPSDDH